MPKIPDHPNLVFILPDRQRRDTMACYGNDWIQVPHLNGLAEESFVFDNCYVTQPVCCPARASILSGQYPINAGMPVNRHILPDSAKTIAEMLSDVYQTGYVGKWHLGNELVAQHGFSEWVACFEHWWQEYSDQNLRTQFSPYHNWLVENGFEPDANHPGGKMFSPEFRANLPAEYHMATYIGTQSADFIRRNADRPFVLYASSKEPHPPFTSPHNTLYDPQTLPVDKTFRRFPEGHSLFNRIRSEFWMGAVHKGSFTHDAARAGTPAELAEDRAVAECGYIGSLEADFVRGRPGRVVRLEQRPFRDNEPV